MKYYLCTWGTNYGLDCCIIAAKDEESATTIAKSDNSGLIWDNFELNEIIPQEKEGIMDIDFFNNY